MLSLPSPYRLNNTHVILAQSLPVQQHPCYPCPVPILAQQHPCYPCPVPILAQQHPCYPCPVPTSSATPMLSLPSPYWLSNTHVIPVQSLPAQQHPCYPCPVPTSSATPMLSLPSPYWLSNTHVIPAQSLPALQHPCYPCPVPTGSATPMLSLPSPCPFCHPIFTSICWPPLSSERGLCTDAGGSSGR